MKAIEEGLMVTENKLQSWQNSQAGVIFPVNALDGIGTASKEYIS